MKRRRRTITLLVLSLLFISAIPASAMGSGDPYLDAQTGLTYSLYKPVNTLGLPQTAFKVLVCGGGGEEWVYTRFSKGKKQIEVMQTMAGSHCSDPGMSVKMPSVKVNGISAQVFVYCDPTQKNASKNCSTAKISTVGGYLLFTLPGYYGMKKVEMQVQGVGGVTYAQLIAIARSMTPASTKASG
jgi:hypothetical protein